MRIYYTDGSCSPNPGPGGFAVIECSLCNNTDLSDVAQQSKTDFSSLDVSSDISHSEKITFESTESKSVEAGLSHKEHLLKPAVLGADKESTNIRMEGKALIAAIKHAEGQECEIHTDSEFWINVVTKWAPGWEAKGWKKSTKGEIQNLDIVKELFDLYKNSNVTLKWVKAHNGHDGNELADEWANKARLGATI